MTDNAEKEEKQEPDHVKRKRLKGLAAGSVVVAASSTQWSKPVVNSLLLPAHAQTSPESMAGDSESMAGDSESMAGDPESMAGDAGPGVGVAMMSFTVTDPDTNMESSVNAPFGFRVGMVDTSTGDFEVMILPMNQTAGLTPSSGFLDWFVQPAIAQTANQIVITGGTLTGTIDLVNGGMATADGNLILGTGEGVGCDCPVQFTVQYNAATGRIEFDQAAFDLDYDIGEFIGTCAALNLNLTELGGITITVPAEDFEAIQAAPDTAELAPADAAEFHARFDTALRTPGNWRRYASFDTNRTLELSQDGTTAIETITGGAITYDAGWTYEKTGPNTGVLSLIDNPSEYEFDRTLHLTFETARSGIARYEEYEPVPDPNEVYNYTRRFIW